MLDIARDKKKVKREKEKRKMRKKEKEKRKMSKSQVTTINIFLLLLFYIEKLIFCSKASLEKLIVTFELQFFFRVEGYWKCSNKTSTPI